LQLQIHGDAFPCDCDIDGVETAVEVELDYFAVLLDLSRGENDGDLQLL